MPNPSLPAKLSIVERLPYLVSLIECNLSFKLTYDTECGSTRRSKVTILSDSNMVQNL